MLESLTTEEMTGGTECSWGFKGRLDSRRFVGAIDSYGELEVLIALKGSDKADFIPWPMAAWVTIIH